MKVNLTNVNEESGDDDKEKNVQEEVVSVKMTHKKNAKSYFTLKAQKIKCWKLIQTRKSMTIFQTIEIMLMDPGGKMAEK